MPFLNIREGVTHSLCSLWHVVCCSFSMFVLNKTKLECVSGFSSYPGVLIKIEVTKMTNILICWVNHLLKEQMNKNMCNFL